jgi:TorA maturation chaperone TorD
LTPARARARLRVGNFLLLRDALMRDMGLDEAIQSAAGIDRAIPGSDLFAQPIGSAGNVDEVDAARAREYALLSVLLARAPDADLLRRLAQIGGDASPLGTSPLGIAHAALAEAARGAGEEHVSREFFALFIGLGRGEFLPYGSYYLTGFLHERPLARLRQDLIRLRIERAPGLAEPEDHAAVLCEIMAGLAGQSLPAPPGADRELFEAHLAPWMGRFFADLERAQAAAFYRSVGMLGRVFMQIEGEAFARSG